MNYYIATICIDGGIEVADNSCDWRDPAFESHHESAERMVNAGVYAETEERAMELAKDWKGYRFNERLDLCYIKGITVEDLLLVEEDVDHAEGYDYENDDYQ